MEELGEQEERDLELLLRLRLALAAYHEADEQNKESARAEYLTLLRAFSRRVIH